MTRLLFGPETDYIRHTARCRPFSDGVSRLTDYRLYSDGEIRVWDGIAKHFTNNHSLDKMQRSVLIRLAIRHGEQVSI